jgi:hypothetical protein
MEVSGQLHDPGKEPPVPTGWALAPVSTREENPAPAGDRTPVVQPGSVNV